MRATESTFQYQVKNIPKNVVDHLRRTNTLPDRTLIVCSVSGTCFQSKMEWKCNNRVSATFVLWPDTVAKDLVYPRAFHEIFDHQCNWGTWCGHGTHSSRILRGSSRDQTWMIAFDSIAKSTFVSPADVCALNDLRIPYKLECLQFPTAENIHAGAPSLLPPLCRLIETFVWTTNIDTEERRYDQFTLYVA